MWSFIPVSQASLPALELEQAVERYVSNLVDGLAISRSAGRVEIQVQALDTRLRLSECFAPLEMHSGDFKGFGRLNVRVSCRNPRPWVLYVPVKVAVYRQAVVAAVPIARGSILQESDMQMSETNILDSGGRHMENAEPAIGMQARRSIQIGNLITEAALKSPTVVHRGDEVRVLARRGDVSVLVSGTALGDGRQGEQIRVRNQQSERIIRALVMGPGEVEAIL